MSFQSGTVQLPGEYFAKEKLVYNDFKVAWAREAIQNSSDGGATKIDLTLKQDYDAKELKVVCQDNGRGMDQDTLINVFLKLGGSKKGEDAIGGFGYAKVILAFAHLRYTIRTQNLEVIGSAGQYDWRETEDFVQGVRLEVDMTTQDNSLWSMEEAIREVVSNSNLKGVTVTLNDEVVSQKTTVLPYAQETALGKLSFGDSEYSGSSTLWMRMNGLAMFKSRVWSDGAAFQGVLDLSGSSLETLTGNRDALCQGKSEILNKIIQDLSNDREKLKLTSDIDLTLNERSVEFERLTAEEKAEVERQARTSQMTTVELVEKLNDLADSFTTPDAIHPFSGLLEKIKTQKTKMDDSVSKIPSHLYPENFKVKFSDSEVKKEDAHAHSAAISASMGLQRNAKLAAGWTRLMTQLLGNEAYRRHLDVEMDKAGQFFYGEYLIQPGFVYGSVMGLNARDTQKKRISIMINPELLRKENYNLADIVDVMHHELAHIRNSHHGESFTISEFKLRKIARDEIGDKQLHRDFKEASTAVGRKRAEPEVSAEPAIEDLRSRPVRHLERQEEFSL